MVLTEPPLTWQLACKAKSPLIFEFKVPEPPDERLA
jgi:hypothetical protein